MNCYPNFAWAYYNLGEIYFYLEEFQNSEWYFEKAIELQPGMAAAYYKLDQVR